MHIRKARNKILSNCLSLLWNISDVNLNEQDDIQCSMVFVLVEATQTKSLNDSEVEASKLLISQLHLLFPLLPLPSAFPCNRDCIHFYKRKFKRKWHKTENTEDYWEEILFFFLKFEGNVQVLSVLFWSHILFENTLINLTKKH